MGVLEIEILKSGLFTSIQDKGRIGLRYYGIPQSGYLDPLAANEALNIVGNLEGTAVLEINQIGPTLLFKHDTEIAVTGGRLSISVNNKTFGESQKEKEMNKLLSIPANSILKLGNVRDGMRAYLAIRGKWEVKEIFNSCSAFTYPSIDIQALKKGDLIKVERTGNTGLASKKRMESVDYKSIKTIPLVPGPEYDLLKDPKQVFEQDFSISPNSNRMAAALEGKTISCQKQEISSGAVFPGTMQLLPNGQIYVILQDGQTTGGYPRIGIIPSQELWKFNQIRPKRGFKFELLV